MTAAERLKQLSGLSGVSAAVMLMALGQGLSASDRLQDHSQLHNVTAAAHLLAESSIVAPEVATGGGSGGGMESGRVTTFSKPYSPGRSTLRLKKRINGDDDEEPTLASEIAAVVAAAPSIAKAEITLTAGNREEIRAQLMAQMQDEEEIEELLAIIAIVLT